MWERLRSGAWLDERRLAVYPPMFLALSVVAIAASLALAQGRFDANGHPLGTDFSQVWVAGLEVLRGRPEAPFDLTTHIAAQREEFGPATDVFGWHYPPFFLAPAAALATLPYLQALALWQISTLLLYLAAVLAILRETAIQRWRVAVAALAFPAVLVNLGHGQNGFLTAALLGFGFPALRERPLVAGLCFGLLAYKPQFALVLPIALVTGGHWRAIAAACATITLTVAASAAAFGLSAWVAFAHGLADTREIVLEQGAAGFTKIQSVFAAVRLLGGDIDLAYGAQSAATLLVVGCLLVLWRSPADWRAKAAATIIASLLATPYSLDYDMAVLAPAVGLMVALGVERGFGPFVKSALAAAFVIPLLARPVATVADLPLGAATLAAFFIVVLGDALHTSGAMKDRSHSIFRAFRRAVFTKISRLIRRPDETLPVASPLSLRRAIWRRMVWRAHRLRTGGHVGAKALVNSVPKEEASCR